MSYQDEWAQRRARELEAVNAREALLTDVCAAGVKLGLWAAFEPLGPRDPDEHPWARQRVVVDAEDLRFTIGSDADRIVAGLADFTVGRFRVTDYDLRRYSESALNATCSASRTPENIAKDLHRRLIGTAEARERARKVREECLRRVAQRQALEGHLKTLEALGYEARRFEPEHYYKAAVAHAEGYGLGFPHLEVRHDGTVSVEPFSLDLAKVPALLALLRRT